MSLSRLLLAALGGCTVVQGLKIESNVQRTYYGSSTLNESSNSDTALAKANAFVQQLNITEKVSMITGTTSGSCVGNIAAIERLNFSGLCLSDGPSAVNRADLVSVFPAGLTAAATWDKNLMYQRGLALAEEFRDKGIHVLLGPVAGPLGRHPLGGRNWEGFSPDPYLTGIAMNSTIRGIQNVGVQSCSKHFIGNEQETQRTNTTSDDGTQVLAISSNIGDRTLHELYLWPFADAVKAGTASVMCSYNRVNETYSCESSALLKSTLKTELGFQNYVVSDFFATHSGAKAVNAGLDMNMPGPIDTDSVYTGQTFFGENIAKAVEDGTVSSDRLDDMVRRIMLPYFLLGQDDDYPTVDPSAALVLATRYDISLLTLGVTTEIAARDVRGNHSSVIRSLGAAATVLLKNENATLPLRSPQNIGVFGNDAADLVEGLTFVDPLPTYGFDIGSLDIGGGSGSGCHTSITSPLEAIKARAKTIGARVQYINSNTILANDDFHSIYPTPEVCLVFLKTFASEGVDRTSFEADWNSTLVVNNVATLCPNTVVITHSGGINTMPWASNPNITAILAAHYPGEQSGNAIVDVLWGDVNPAGKLPYTIPVKEADYNIPIVNLTGDAANEENAWQSNFTEGLMIDYRHFDNYNITPLFEFGYGLSYTTFDLVAPLSMSRLRDRITAEPDTTMGIALGGNPDLWTSVLRATTQVSNTGSVLGSTVVQLYVSMPRDEVPSGTPIRVLRGFEKVQLQPGETKDVALELTRRDISYWDTVRQTWRIPTGKITFSVGFSSRDLRKESELEVVM